METSNGSPDPWSFSLGHEAFEEALADWNSENPLDNYNAADWIADDPVSYIAATPQVPVNTSNFPGQLSGFLEGPMPMAVLPCFSPMMDITSPSSSGGASSTSALAELGSISSPTMSEPGLSPFSPMGQSPLAWRDLLQSPITNPMPQPFAAQPNTNAYIGGAAIFEESTPPGVHVRQPSSQIAVATRQLTMEDKPPGMSARKWRKIIKPEKCPECPMGFDYLGERDKHIAAAHTDVADKHGVLVETYVCSSCGSVYTRKDRLTRHMTNKHGRMPKKKRHRK